MNKDKLTTSKDFHGTRLAVFVVKQHNHVLGRTRWIVYQQYPHSAPLLLGTFRWRWVARRKMKAAAGVRSWEDTE